MLAHLAHLPGTSGLAPAAPGSRPGRAGRDTDSRPRQPERARPGAEEPCHCRGGQWAWAAAQGVWQSCQGHLALRNCLVSQREGVWPPTDPCSVGPTCPSSLLPGHASPYLPLRYFLEPPALCLCPFLCLVCPFPNFHCSSLIRALASFGLP